MNARDRTWLTADEELDYMEVRVRETDQEAASICTTAGGINWRLRVMDQSRGCMFIWSMWYLKVRRLNINIQVFTFIEKKKLLHLLPSESPLVHNPSCANNWLELISPSYIRHVRSQSPLAWSPLDTKYQLLFMTQLILQFVS